MRRLLLILLFLFGRVALADGTESFSPSKLEWLALEANANYRREMTTEQPGVYFEEVPPNTIKIVIQSRPRVDHMQIKLAEEVAKTCLQFVADKHKWTWYKIIVETSVVKVGFAKEHMDEIKKKLAK